MNVFSTSHLRPRGGESPVPSDVPRVNWLSIVRTGPTEPVSGAFVVSPARRVPEPLLAPLCGKPGCVRANLHLGSEATVDADVWVAGITKLGKYLYQPIESYQ
ncbi:hypothetical protein AURDEDRAFT_170446 [Auricularia subglabra TFB-10046 SS5]|nr:hypothetical protein AURDEDRAFT_170446 [Auricularia subglabra TFB-10046 SS5]